MNADLRVYKKRKTALQGSRAADQKNNVYCLKPTAITANPEAFPEAGFKEASITTSTVEFTLKSQ